MWDVTLHEWVNAPTEDLLTCAYAHHTNANGACTIPENKWNDPLLVPFIEHAASIFEEIGAPVKEWKYWASIIHPEWKHTEEGWANGFPHTHGWNGITLVHYVQVPDSGGELVVLDDLKNEVTSVTPQVGMSATVGGSDSHGVRGVHGITPRITMIATGMIR